MSLVVFSLEPWGEVRRRIRILVDEIVDLDPRLQVLYVRPATDILDRLRHGKLATAERLPAGDRSIPASTCCGPGSGCPVSLGPFADRCSGAPSPRCRR